MGVGARWLVSGWLRGDDRARGWVLEVVGAIGAAPRHGLAGWWVWAGRGTATVYVCRTRLAHLEWSRRADKFTLVNGPTLMGLALLVLSMLVSLKP